jgi:hypothetical protein
MADPTTLDGFLAGAHVDEAVLALRPDYRALLVAVDGIVPGPSDEATDALLRSAEAAAAELLRDRPAEQLPHVAAWRRPIGRSTPSRSAPATASRRCCVGLRPDYRG